MELLKPELILIKSKPIKSIKHFKSILSLDQLSKMIKLCYTNNGMAIAAPQVGIFYRFFISLYEEDYKYRIYINPKYNKLKESKQFKNIEGCLSYGKDKFKVSRLDYIFANWIEIEKDNFVEKFEKLDGLNSVEFQHETDHLDGITIATKGEKIR